MFFSSHYIWCFVKFSSLSFWGCPVLLIYNFTSNPHDLLNIIRRIYSGFIAKTLLHVKTFSFLKCSVIGFYQTWIICFVTKVQHQYQLLIHHHPTDLYDQERLFTQYEVFTSPADWPFVWSSALLSFSASIIVIRNINIVIWLHTANYITLLLSPVSHHQLSLEAFQGPPPTLFDVPRYFAFSRTSPWLIFIQTHNIKDCFFAAGFSSNTSFSSHFCKPPS